MHWYIIVWCYASIIVIIIIVIIFTLFCQFNITIFISHKHNYKKNVILCMGLLYMNKWYIYKCFIQRHFTVQINDTSIVLIEPEVIT